MFSYFLFALFAVLEVQGKFNNFFNRPDPFSPPGPGAEVNFGYGNYRLCTYTNEAYQKCATTLEAAKNSSIKLPLRCVQKQNRTECIRSLRTREAHMVVLTGHGYAEGRRYGLRPAIFGEENNTSLYVAVAPRNISLVSIAEAPIVVNQSISRAFHAALLFNLNRGHEICRLFNNAAESVSIKIVDSAQYQLKDDEILLCPNRTFAEAKDFRECNFEADLQRAVFVDPRTPLNIINNMKTRIFDVILRRFNTNANGNQFNFFSTFQGQDDLIFKNDTIAFALIPTYRNGITEKVFDQLHCNTEDLIHDPSQLE